MEERSLLALGRFRREERAALAVAGEQVASFYTLSTPATESVRIGCLAR